MIVADTCLVFHLFNETSLTEKAQKILELEPHWILPTLWKEEYANILSKLARKEKMMASVVVKNYEFTASKLRNFEIIVDVKQALEISINYKISVYDAHFIAVAREFETIVVTDDQEVLKKCPDFALSFERFLYGH